MKTFSSKVSTFLLRATTLALALCTTTQASTDYGPAIWRPCYPSHLNTSGYGHKFHVIHDMEGYYLSTISYFQRSTTQASVHYFVNGKKDYASDANPGEVSQGVRDIYYAWHVRCWNSHSTGTEHEGFASNPAWYTEAMYVASAGITKHLKARFGWPMDRNHVIGHDQKRISGWPTYARANFGIDPYCNDHTDPGPYWNWTHYMALCNGTSISTPSAPSSLVATTVSSSRIDLKWKDNSSIESQFKIERATSSSGPWTQIGTTSANDVTFSATSLSSGVKYYFRVRASNSAGNSGFSNVASATTTDTIPGAPTSLITTTVSSSQINLSWTQGAGNEDGFKIERSIDGTTFSQIATVGINVTTYQNTGLLGNRNYFYRVRSYNTAGNSAYSNVSSATTAPQAPTALGAVATSSSVVELSWTDNSSSESGFRIERGTAAAGPFTQIASMSAGTSTYTDAGRAAVTTYYYRVRSFNANGNSDYSNVASATTPNSPPILGAVGNRTVMVTNALAFTATASDPNPVVTTTTWQTFESFSPDLANEQVMFKRPSNSGTTDQFQDLTATNYTLIVTNGPSGNGSSRTLKAGWTFLAGQTNPWVRLNTFNTANVPNPTIALDQILRFKVYASKAVKLGIGIRETGTAAAYGADGGTTGTIDWAGVTNVVSGNPIASHAVAAASWQTISFNIPFEPQRGFSGDGVIPQTGKGVLEHIAILADGGSGAYTVYFDDFAIVAQNTLAYSLDAGAPAGAIIGRRTGKFSWTPTISQVGTFTITARVTDQYGAQDSETFKITVNAPGGNSAPVLATIGNKIVNEGSLLTFTATATDADAAQSKTFTLDAGVPLGAEINPATGVFTWTPTEAQGPSTNTITVRVTDNGSPALSHSETISVIVKEVNAAPTLAAISNRSVNEGSALSVTVSASDSDIPANTLTYSLDPGAPTGMTINPSTGTISWTPSEAQGGETYPVTVRVKDNGVPSLYATRTFTVTVNELNSPPSLVIGGSATIVQSLTDFEHNETGPYPGNVVFRNPSFSSTTSPFLDLSSNAPNLTAVETDFPDRDVNISAKALHANWSFKTGTTNPWIRLTTFATSTIYDLPNPTVSFSQKIRFDIWTDKSLKVGLGIRETGTGAPIGANGGTTGTLEWIGVPSKNGSAPNPSRVVAAGSWTTLEFDLVTDTVISALGSGDGILSSPTGKGVLEHLAIVPNGGMGTYEVYLDNFEVVNTSSTFVVDTGATFTLPTSGLDPDIPAQNLTFSLAAGAPANASIHPDTGLFSWTPTPLQSPSTNVITVRVTDDGTPSLSGTASFTVRVNKVNTAPRLAQLNDQAVELDSNETVTFTASAQDEDIPADNLVYSLVAPFPSGATIHAATGAFSWRPPNAIGTTVITVRVTDNGSPVLYDEQNVSIEVLPKNAAPQLAAISNFTVTVGATVNFTAVATDSDVPAQPLYFALDADAPPDAFIDATNGVFSWTPSSSKLGPNEISVIVSDSPANGASPKRGSRTFNVMVNAPQPPHIDAGQYFSEQGMRLYFTADTNLSYWVDVSTNLLDWMPLTNVANPTGTFEVLDSEAGTNGPRFYRARWTP